MILSSIPLKKIITAQTAANFYAPIPAFMNGKYVEWTVYAVFSNGSAAGAVVIETAPEENFQGTWSNITTITWADNTCKHVSVTGIFGTVRARISSAITSGTVDVWIVAANN